MSRLQDYNQGLFTGKIVIRIVNKLRIKLKGEYLPSRQFINHYGKTEFQVNADKSLHFSLNYLSHIKLLILKYAS